ncbi:hypothetical protein [Marinobacter antarcticus]|uniref:hypothetical protein n=1 Tax=Marinobacter antarcticus TaxID=564117 RepID=UPI0026EFBE63|nr:hypothetical protein [Marinobacter antarcticus]
MSTHRPWWGPGLSRLYAKRRLSAPHSSKNIMCPVIDLGDELPTVLSAAPRNSAPASGPEWHLWPGLIIASALVVLALAGLDALVWQAFLSVLLSLLVAVPVSRILADSVCNL